MIVFINFLRFLATILITNAHYIDVYPTNWLAHGGMLGNVLFFAISGYCLYNINTNFARWYSKRFIKIYIPTLIISILYILIGYFKITDEQNLFWWLVYPTFYHFVSSILIVYIPFYFIMKYDKLKNNILRVMLAIALVYVVIYIFIFDKTYYHIDDISSPVIRFMFIEAMLMGVWFRQNDKKFRNGKILIPLIGTAFFFAIFFASKVAFSRISQISVFQFLNQIILLLLLYFVFRLFACLDSKLEKMPKFILKPVNYISRFTLEIYLVQHMLIEYLDIRFRFSFPLNWLILTASIFVVALVLHYVSDLIIKPLTRLTQKEKQIQQKV